MFDVCGRRDSSVDCLSSVARNEQDDRRLRRLQERELQQDDDDGRER